MGGSTLRGGEVSALPTAAQCDALPLPIRTGEVLGWSHLHETFKLVQLLFSPLLTVLSFPCSSGLEPVLAG